MDYDTYHSATNRLNGEFGFWRGADLRAPDGPLQTGGTKMDHIKLTGLADVNREVFQKLVKDAVKLNQTRGDPTKGK